MPAHLEILDKADGIIRALETGELTAGAIAERIGEPVSSTYRILRSLTALDWIMPGSERGRYRLGLQVLTAGSAFIDALDIRALLRPLLLDLRDRTMLTVYLCVPSGTEAVCIERLAGHGVRSLDLVIGGSLPLSRGGASKAMLAALSDEDAEEVLKELGLPPARRKELQAERKATSARGYAISDEDVTRGVAALGSPVFDHLGRLAGAISVGGLRDGVIGREDVAGALRAAAAAGSELLGWVPQDA